MINNEKRERDPLQINGIEIRTGKIFVSGMCQFVRPDI